MSLSHGSQSCQGFSSRVKRCLMCSCFIKAPYLVTLNWSGWAPAGGWAVLCSDFFAFSRSFLIKQKEISHQKNHLREREPLPTTVQLKIYITKIFKYCKFSIYLLSQLCHTTHICNGFFLTTSFEKWGKTDHFIKIMNPRYLTFLYLDSYNFSYMAAYLVESVCCKKQQKSSWPVTCLWNIRRFWMVKDWFWMIKGITWTHIQSIWNHSGPSEVPHSANQ